MAIKVARFTSMYGFNSDKPFTQFEWELLAFRHGITPADGGLGRLQHFKNAVAMALPNLEWNDWLEQQMESLMRTDYAQIQGENVVRIVSWAGPASAGKTFGSGLFAFFWWLSDGENSIVALTSTTGKMVRKRVWPVISSLYTQTRQGLSRLWGIPENKVPLGNFIDSRTTLQWQKGDDKHSISCVAVKNGDTARSMSDIQGQHAPRVLVIVDEADATPEAIVKVCENLRKGCQDFTLLLIANPDASMNPHREYSEPVNGWASVTVEDGEWMTKKGGLCVHFDGFKSPNVTRKRTVYPYLYTYEDYLSALKRDAENSIEGWKYDRGFWAPEGVRNTVFTPAMVDNHDGRGTLIFQTYSFMASSLDPAFGGDECVQKFAKIGDIDRDGKIGIQLTEKVLIRPSATCKDTFDKQVADQAAENCRIRNVAPEHFACDATGTGRGVYSHMYSDWSHKIVRVEFGGEPSDMPVSLIDLRTAKEAYDRKVTELWMDCAEFLQGGQLKGLTTEDIRQFCSRKFEVRLRKTVLETKGECKLHLSRSPDDADAVAVMIHLAKTLGATAGGLLKGNPNADWEKACEEVNSAQEPVDYSQENDYDAEDRYAAF